MSEVSKFSKFSSRALDLMGRNSPCSQCKHKPPPDTLFCRAMSERVEVEAVQGECPWFERRDDDDQ